MGVLINKKRCDNTDVCPCIEECPAGAFYWDDKKKSVAVDDNLCVNCRQCVITCEAGAVKVARTEEEYQNLKTEYDEDIMSIEELFQDRFGASIVDEKYSLGLDELHQLTKDSNKLLLVEFYNDDQANCLINSIPINEIVMEIKAPISYRKINVGDVNLLNQYDINALPTLVIFSKGKVIFKYCGFLDVAAKEKMLEKLKEVNPF